MDEVHSLGQRFHGGGMKCVNACLLWDGKVCASLPVGKTAFHGGGMVPIVGATLRGGGMPARGKTERVNACLLWDVRPLTAFRGGVLCFPVGKTAFDRK